MDPQATIAPRLGLDVPFEWWPGPAAVKAIEAAGFGWVQLFAPPPTILADPKRAGRHARAVREALDATALGAVVHAPFELQVGDYEHDLAFAGLLGYASEAGARYVAYHAGDWPASGGPRVQDRLSLEERSLRTLARRAESLSVVIAIENLAPAWPGPQHLSHSPLFLRELVQRIGSPALRILIDVGHAHIVASLLHTHAARLVQPALDAVCLFHVHDNLGGRLDGAGEPALDPLRLDLHLPPGAGTADWDALAPLLVGHAAPLVLEVHPAQRPDLVGLRDGVEALLLGQGRGAAVDPAPSVAA